MLLIFENFGGKTPRNTKLKIFRKPTKIFENQREINKKTPNLKFGTKFNREIIIFEKDFLKRVYQTATDLDQRSSQLGINMTLDADIPINALKGTQVENFKEKYEICN